MKKSEKYADRMIKIEEAVEYEIFSSWWIGFVPGRFMNELAARYYVWKTKRKHVRYAEAKQIQEKIEIKKLLTR